jgi:hypothetical protein
VTTWRMEGAATVAASLAHNGEREGTTTYFRTEKVIQPDGSWVHVPIGSGNGLRGLLRDVSADLLWQLMGRPTLAAPVYHFLYSGGQLGKAGSTKVMGSRQLATLRALVPHVGLFGGSGAGRIIEVRLAVGKLVPVVTETAHLVPPGLLTGGERSIYEYAQIEEFSRRDDTHRAHSAQAIDATVRPELLSGDDALLKLEDGVEAPREGPANQMRYGMQTLPMGLRMYWWLRLSNVTDLEAAWFAAVLQAWAADGAVFGGRSATGHGRLLLEHAGWVASRPQLTAGVDLPAQQDLAGHVTTHQEQIMECLRLVG